MAKNCFRARANCFLGGREFLPRPIITMRVVFWEMYKGMPLPVEEVGVGSQWTALLGRVFKKREIIADRPLLYRPLSFVREVTLKGEK